MQDDDDFDMREHPIDAALRKKPENRKVNGGWALHSALIEIHWKRGQKGLYADRVRLNGTEFHYISGKKATVVK